MNNSHFDWQADEDEDLISPPEQGQRGRGKGRLWLIVAVLLLIGLASLLTVRFFNQRQRRLEEEMRQDVQGSFNLWQKALDQKDGELYAHLLDGSDRKWLQSQKQLFEKDLVLQRAFLSLSIMDEAGAAPEVILSPDWQQATVTFERPYSMAPGAAFNEPVRLQHTAVFKNQDAGWLQIALDENFWGDWATAETDLLMVHYPTRDEELALRISRRLEAQLHEICDLSSGTADRCARLKPFVLKMSPAPGSLEALDTLDGSLLPGYIFDLPAPTIVGLPVDETSFQAFYHGYTRGLLEHVRTAVGSPAPLPEQLIRTLCYNHPSPGPRLYKYDPAYGAWEAELPDRSFRYLLSLPGEQGLILDEIVGEWDSLHSRLVHWQEGSEKLLLDENTAEETFRVIGSASDVGSHLLLRRLAAGQAAYDYTNLDLRACDEMGCDLGELPGYAVWSPGGQQTILQIGSEVFLGDALGQIHGLIGRGFNPFWLDDETVAYIRFIAQGAELTSEFVTHQIVSADDHALFNTADLAGAAEIAGDGLSIRYVTPNPADPNILLVQASGLNDYAGDYFIFSVPLLVDRGPEADPGILFHLRREGSPGGDTGRVLSSGYMPFVPSPNGRWLVISELSGYDSAKRTSLLYDLHQKQTAIISQGDSVSPAQFPSYDWSADGRWLVITGDGFLRLIAPEYDYEQLVPHEFDYCGLVRWSD